MRSRDGRGAVFALSLLVLASLGRAAAPPTPAEFLGFTLGADRQLADYKQIVSYLEALDAASDRVELERLGPTTLGQELVLVTISTPENLRNKERYREIARRLADPRGLAPAEVDALVREGKVICVVSAGIHSNEIGASQMVLEWAYSLASADDPETLRRLDRVILLVIPSLNPDGHQMVTEWYRKHVGTPYEGGRMPWLYHPYVGHDDNRDWFMLTQKETQAVTRAVTRHWFPQVWLDEHQMGITGPRMFVPPYTNPIAARIHPLVWRTVDHAGTLMSWRLEQAAKRGVGSAFIFDGYWPGDTIGTTWFKNIVGLLTEVASARVATPVVIAQGELVGGAKGLVEYRQQANFPNPWPGGTWRLRDIMDYERTASDALLELCADRRTELLAGIATMAQSAVAAAAPGEAYRIPRAQHDPSAAPRLAHLLAAHNVEVRTTADAFLVPLAQPYSRFVEEMLATHRYPEVRPAKGSDIIQPYDMTTWSLPLLLGLRIERTTLPLEAIAQAAPLAEDDWPQGGLNDAGAPLYALSPESNAATRLVNELLERKAKVEVADVPFDSGGRRFPTGTALLEPGGDLAALAAQEHLTVVGLAERPVVAATSLRRVRVGLVKPWLASIDEGWTRFLLEQHAFDVTTLDNKTIKDGHLEKLVDAVVIPAIAKEVLVDGCPHREEGEMKYFAELPPEYAGGIGKEGTAELVRFVEAGGALVALSAAADFVIEAFNLPVRNVLAKAKPAEFDAAGSLLRVRVDATHPVGYGMPPEAAAFVDENVAFETVPPGAELTRWIVASYPDDQRDILLSGWLKGAERLERRAAVVALTYGKGKIVLLGFRVQHRAQTEGTFKLLFGALRWAGMSSH